MKQLIKIYYPNYGKTATLDNEMYKVALGEKAKYLQNVRFFKFKEIK